MCCSIFRAALVFDFVLNQRDGLILVEDDAQNFCPKGGIQDNILLNNPFWSLVNFVVLLKQDSIPV